jgi:hypothetical protein
MSEPSTPSSPLATVDPNSLDSIWAKDPNLMTQQDVERVVDELQAKRTTFLNNPEAVKKQRGKRVSVDDAKIGSIEDLGL